MPTHDRFWGIKYGAITPDGTFHPCGYGEHYILAGNLERFARGEYGDNRAAAKSLRGTIFVHDDGYTVEGSSKAWHYGEVPPTFEQLETILEILETLTDNRQLWYSARHLLIDFHGLDENYRKCEVCDLGRRECYNRAPRGHARNKCSMGICDGTGYAECEVCGGQGIIPISEVK